MFFKSGVNVLPKWLFIIPLACLLTSCIEVKNFGESWDKAGLDKRLVGGWERVPVTPDQEGGNEIGAMTDFTEEDGVFKITYSKPDSNQDEKYTAKTMDAGPYQFILVGPDKGFMMRYKMADPDTVTYCSADGASTVSFVEKTYPDAKSVVRNDGDGIHLVVSVLDDEAIKIIASIPDTDEYWKCDFKDTRRKEK